MTAAAAFLFQCPDEIVEMYKHSNKLFHFIFLVVICSLLEIVVFLAKLCLYILFIMNAVVFRNLRIDYF